MPQPDLEELVASTGNLGTLPGTVVELLYLLNDATECAENVQKIIERDPAMTANVLKLGNSAFYGVKRDITSVRDALVLLGNRCVAALSFATGMSTVLRQDLTGYGLTRHEFWTHCLITGAGASEAIRHSGQPQFCCEAFTAGLVHDMGMLVIDPWLTKNELVIRPKGPMQGVCTQEIEILGFDHCLAGKTLASRWGFPDSLLEPIAHHHLLDEATMGTEICRAVAAGNIMAEGLDDGLEGEGSPEVSQSLTQLGFNNDLLEKVRLDLTTNLEKTLVRATSTAPVEV
ncbi:MAG: HDOD domain-containing protein [bacterium]|nr:HDOD domain-containing protein [bacterium]